MPNRSSLLYVSFLAKTNDSREKVPAGKKKVPMSEYLDGMAGSKFVLSVRRCVVREEVGSLRVDRVEFGLDAGVLLRCQVGDQVSKLVSCCVDLTGRYDRAGLGVVRNAFALCDVVDRVLYLRWCCLVQLALSSAVGHDRGDCVLGGVNLKLCGAELFS